MNEIKKELLAVILIFILGVLALLFLSNRAEQYGKTHPTKDYPYRISHLENK